ncbi:MAG: TlpA family protein disulfide reductase, partial [Oxalobacteraceae bacterium]|nr:TlpA family protein disulfide reductase [Oxalobacteraceae bacterium]
MLSVNLGPLALPMDVLSLLAAGVVAAGVGHWVGRRTQTGIVNNLSDMLIAAVLAARIGFVATWFELYRATPWWSMIDIRDGGFLLWPGVAAAVLVALWQGWRRPGLRKPLAAGLAAGALVWSAFFAAT